MPAYDGFEPRDAIHEVTLFNCPQEYRGQKPNAIGSARVELASADFIDGRPEQVHDIGGRRQAQV
jgi:hypothetical protein